MIKTVREIQEAIEAISPKEYKQLIKWILEKDWEQWDEEISKDSEAGRLDFLTNEIKESRTL